MQIFLQLHSSLNRKVLYTHKILWNTEIKEVVIPNSLIEKAFIFYHQFLKTAWKYSLCKHSLLSKLPLHRFHSSSTFLILTFQFLKENFDLWTDFTFLETVFLLLYYSRSVQYTDIYILALIHILPRDKLIAKWLLGSGGPVLYLPCHLVQVLRKTGTFTQVVSGKLHLISGWFKWKAAGTVQHCCNLQHWKASLQSWLITQHMP